MVLRLILSLHSLSTKVDPLWDNEQTRKELLGLLRGALGDVQVGIRVFRYPLSRGLFDIAWKFNV